MPGKINLRQGRFMLGLWGYSPWKGRHGPRLRGHNLVMRKRELKTSQLAALLYLIQDPSSQDVATYIQSRSSLLRMVLTEAYPCVSINLINVRNKMNEQGTLQRADSSLACVTTLEAQSPGH